MTLLIDLQSVIASETMIKWSSLRTATQLCWFIVNLSDFIIVFASSRRWTDEFEESTWRTRQLRSINRKFYQITMSTSKWCGFREFRKKKIASNLWEEAEAIWYAQYNDCMKSMLMNEKTNCSYVCSRSRQSSNSSREIRTVYII